MTARNAKSAFRIVAFGIVVILAVLGRDSVTQAPAERPAIEASDGDRQIQDLFEARRSDEVVVISGVVDRLLSDDNDDSRHQRFIVRLESGHTLLVAHNIDLADRVPLGVGDPVNLRGEYEWNEQGGLLHWTHHDPQARREGGWIEYKGIRYR
jgi:hypothetical protein